MSLPHLVHTPVDSAVATFDERWEIALGLAASMVEGFVAGDEKTVLDSIQMAGVRNVWPQVERTLLQFLAAAMAAGPGPGGSDESIALRAAKEARGLITTGDARAAISAARGGSGSFRPGADFTFALVLLAGYWFDSVGVSVAERVAAVRAVHADIDMIHELHRLTASSHS